MFNFGTFWNQFGSFMKENQFDKHFEKPDSFEDMLNDDGIISEFRNQNQKLMEFMKLKHFIQLVDYIMIPPKDDSDSKRAFRYPFYACEILCCDNAKLINTFFPKDEDLSEPEKDKQPPEDTQEQNTAEEKEGKEEKEEKEEEESKEQTPETTQSAMPQQEEQEQQIDLFLYFCQFILNNEPDTLNLILAGYFAKVFNNLYSRKTETILNIFFEQDNQDYLKQLIQLIHSRSLAEVLSKFLTFEKDLTLNDEKQFVSQRNDILVQLIRKLETSKDNFEVATNILVVIQDVCSKAYSISCGNQLVQQLLSEECFSVLCECLTSEDKYISIAGSSIVYSLLNLAYNDELRNQDVDEQDNLNLELFKAFELLKAALPGINEYLQKEQQKTIEFSIQPLGQTKLKLVESIYLLLKLKSDEVAGLLQEINIFKTLNRLVVLHEHNNLFHLQYHNIVTTILENDTQPLIQNLMVENQFVKFLSELTSNAENGKQRRGYLGFVNKLGRFLQDLSDKKADLKEYLQVAEWEQFKKNYFAKAQENISRDLGGFTTSSKKEEDVHFKKEDIQDRYNNFLTSDKKQEEAPQQQQQQQQDFFADFSSSASQDQSSANFSNFEWDSNQATTNSSQSNFGWDQSSSDQSSQQDQDIPLVDYWKIQINNDWEAKALQEFEANL